MTAAAVVVATASALRALAPGAMAAVHDPRAAAHAAADVLRAFTPAGLAVVVRPAQTLSQVVLFVGLLIRSCFGGGWRDSERGIADHLYMLAWLLAALCVGLVFNQPSLSSTACVFGVLWGMTSAAQALAKSRAFVLAAFGGSLLAWRGAVLLHAQPALLLGMFSDAAARESYAVLASGQLLASFGRLDQACLGLAVVCFLLAGGALLGTSAAVRR